MDDSDLIWEVGLAFSPYIFVKSSGPLSQHQASFISASEISRPIIQGKSACVTFPFLPKEPATSFN